MYIRPIIVKYSVVDLQCIWQMEVLEQTTRMMSGALGYISFCVNPFIYASRYEVFRRYLKQMFYKNSTAPVNARGINIAVQQAAAQR